MSGQNYINLDMEKNIANNKRIKMEEKKINPEMKVVNGGATPKKFSYEELEQIAHQLSEQNKQLYEKLGQLNYTNMFKRLDYLFKVLEMGHQFTSEFVINCADEIVGILTIPDTEVEEGK